MELESLMGCIFQSKETFLVPVRNEGVLKDCENRKSKEVQNGYEEALRNKGLHNLFHIVITEVPGKYKWY